MSASYFYGLPWSKHIVIYDTLIEKSTTSEIEAVLGHELGHWYYCRSEGHPGSFWWSLTMQRTPASFF